MFNDGCHNIPTSTLELTIARETVCALSGGRRLQHHLMPIVLWDVSRSQLALCPSKKGKGRTHPSKIPVHSTP